MVGRWTWGGDTSDRGCVTVPRGPGCGPQAVARCRIGPMASTILIVEDEHAVARGIEYALQQEGYTVALARSGEEGLELAVGQAPDLVILDVRLPGIDGFEVLRRLRATGSRAPVLMLTARDDEFDKVIGLELGADDYVTKPFGLRELLSRVKALLRRAYGDLADASGGRVIRHDDLVIDLERRRGQRGARPVRLTLAFVAILALTLSLVTVGVLNRLGDYFDQQQREDLTARSLGVAQYVALVAESASTVRPVVGLDNVVDPGVVVQLTRNTQERILADRLGKAGVRIRLGIVVDRKVTPASNGGFTGLPP